MDRIRTALIGCGKVADTHAQALQSLPESEFVAVYDTDLARAEAFAERYHIRAYSDLQEMLRHSNAQMASICTPHPTHPELAVACALAGVHPLVEKPLAADLKGCDRAIAAADAAGVKLGVVSQRRSYPPVLRMKQAIEAGKIGRPILGALVVMGWRDAAYYRMDSWRGKWSTEGGGVMINQTTHQIDLFQWFMGPIAELFGYWANLNHPTIEVDDSVVGVVRFKNGALGSILLSNSQKPGFYAKIHVHGENGASVGVQTDGGSPFVSGVTQAVDPPFNDIWTVPGEEVLLGQWQSEDRALCESLNIMTYYHRLQIKDFLRAIIEDRAPAVDGREGRKLVEIFCAVYRSQRDRQPAKFPLDATIGSEDFDGRLASQPQV
ncbi:MAG: Gfo/Idh/MocA family oxidoreductase [Chloroflexi bacterium]|nr:Gfo/Idh/MocA family oxidoreductase [Chloroflexota bacterium]